MKRRLFLATMFVFAGAVTSLADTDAEVNARKNALDVAGAFTNDGFKLRDGHWCGTLKEQDHALIAVNLYAGNQYWFAVGTADPAKKIAVNVYDETGRLLKIEHYEGGDRAAAGFSPSDSGQYFVSVDLVEGGSSSFCLIYSYK
jgi:hypothetical protein